MSLPTYDPNGPITDDDIFLANLHYQALKPRILGTKYDIVRYCYNKGLYTKDQVKEFLDAGEIKEEQYNKIIGET